jgi:hypothetical protein
MRGVSGVAQGGDDGAWSETGLQTSDGIGVDRRQGVFGASEGLLDAGQERVADQDAVDAFWSARVNAGGR